MTKEEIRERLEFIRIQIKMRHDSGTCRRCIYCEKRDEKMTELKSKVETILLQKYDFEQAEASEAIEDSVKDAPELWHEDADVEYLANLLASGE